MLPELAFLNWLYDVYDGSDISEPREKVYNKYMDWKRQQAPRAVQDEGFSTPEFSFEQIAGRIKIFPVSTTPYAYDTEKGV